MPTSRRDFLHLPRRQRRRSMRRSAQRLAPCRSSARRGAWRRRPPAASASAPTKTHTDPDRLSSMRSRAHSPSVIVLVRGRRRRPVGAGAQARCPAGAGDARLRIPRDPRRGGDRVHHAGTRRRHGLADLRAGRDLARHMSRPVVDVPVTGTLELTLRADGGQGGGRGPDLHLQSEQPDGHAARREGHGGVHHRRAEARTER